VTSRVVQNPREQKLGAAHWSDAVQVPRHLPVSPHVYGAQLGRPSSPRASSVQVPSEPAALQTSHEPAHARSQQVPSEQWPEAQTPASAHATPGSSLGRQVPPEQ
jgi:hypothetical protein